MELRSQVTIVPHHFLYKEIDHQECSTIEMEFVFPVFYSQNNEPLTIVNDSVRKIFQDCVGMKEGFLTASVNGGKDTSILIADTLTLFDCDEISLMPYTEYLDYAIFINEEQFLSLSITYSNHAGSRGNAWGSTSYSMCYDLKRERWIDLKTLFPNNSEKQLLHKTDSFYLAATGYERIEVDKCFNGEISIRPGYVAFYYSDYRGANTFYQEILIPYEDCKKHLSRRYKKLMKPVAPKATGV